MVEFDCSECGVHYDDAGSLSDDKFTSISVSFHDDSRDDFADSFCQSCADDILSDLYDASLEAGR